MSETKQGVAGVASVARDGIVAEWADGVAWFRIDRQDRRNMLDMAAVARLTGLFQRADRDHRVRCIVLTGTGRDFCTGGDLSPAAQEQAAAETFGGSDADPWAGADGAGEPSAVDYRWPLITYQEFFRTLWELETPVVSAVNGTVAGIGWMVALLADFVVGAEGARWTHAFARRGMMPHAGDTVFLPRLLPLHRLNEIAMLSDPITTEVLAGWGIVARVVPADEVESAAGDLAARLAAGPTLSLGQAKRLYRRSLLADVEVAFSEERAATALLSTTSDREEGMSAMLEGRKPHFSGS